MQHDLRSFRRSRVLAFVVGFVLAAVAGALAAVIIYDHTVGGSLPGNPVTIQTTHMDALSFQADGAAPALDSNATVQVPVKLVNNDSSNAHSLGGLPDANALVVTVADDQNAAQCSPHLSVTSNTAADWPDGLNVPAGGQISGSVSIHADDSLPLACNGTTYTVTFSGQTLN